MALKEQLGEVKTLVETLFQKLRYLAESIGTEVGREAQLKIEIEAKKVEFAGHVAKIDAAKLEHAAVKKATEEAKALKDVAEKALSDAKAALAALKARL